MTESERDADQRPAPVWWRRRRWQALVAVVALTGATLGATAWARREGPELPGTSPVVVYAMDPLSPGKADFSLGHVEIRAPGKTVQVVSVNALTTPNVEQLGAYVVWPRDDADDTRLGSAVGFPYADERYRHGLTEVVPASETSYVAPGEAEPIPVGIHVGFRVLSGMGGVNGISVTYKVNGKTEREYFGVAAFACVEPKLCKKEGEDIDLYETVRQLGLIRG